jgi:outer membrane protein assembly factor BamB
MLAVLNFSRSLIKRTFFISMALSLLTALVSLASGIIETAGSRPPENLVSRQNILFLGSYTHSQDVTTDGENYYFSARWSLTKTTLDGETETAMNINAIPRELKEKYGSAHIGGISYYNGKIYAALEDSKVWQYPIVALYDADTLAYTGEFHILSAELQKNGLPWIAVDAENGFIYAAQRDNSPALIVYDLETFELVKTVPLSVPVHKIQGGEMYKGLLYVATQDETQAVYAINPLTGVTNKCFDQNLPKGGEAEGLTMLETPDGAVFHTLDLGPMFINAYFRHYAPVE